MRILVVEDDELTTQALSHILSHQGYIVETARDGETAWDLVESFSYDLILLDVVIPRLDGINLCRRLRTKGYRMPILLLTARDSSHDKALGLDAGADDYVVKPFDPEELGARIRALLRRGGVLSQPVLTWGALQLDPSSCEVTYADQLLSLTPKEYGLLELFLRNNNRVFSCGVILEQLWAFEETPGEEAVRTHIKGLRQKLRAAGAPTDLLETVYGIGYRLKPIEKQVRSPSRSGEAEEQRSRGAEESGRTGERRSRGGRVITSGSQVNLDVSPLNVSGGSGASGSEVAHQQTIAAIASVWHRFKGRVLGQITILEQAIDALAERSLDTALKQQAEQEAHSLAGALGTFGFPRGSDLARSIEQSFKPKVPAPDQADQLKQWVTALRQEVDRPSDESPSPTSSLVSDPDLSHQAPLLLVIDGDRTTAEQMTTAAIGWGFQTITVNSLAKARASIAQTPPQVVLLDPNVSTLPAESLQLLAELSQHQPAIPVLIFSDQDHLSVTPEAHLRQRLEIARLGGQAFLPKPVIPSRVMEAIAQVLQETEKKQQSVTSEATILVVDDDPKILTILQALLKPWGFDLVTLTDSRRFWEVLEATCPDLLILDIKMPHVSGVELCQVVRNDSRWSSLPVLFLTAHSDAKTIHEVFTVGADDFVSKPIVGPELVVRIVNRLDRMRYLKQLAETDPLTKVCNRHKSMQDLDRLLHIAERQNQPFCLAVLDLDYFRQVNYRYGHAVGDAILCHISQLLKQEFGGEDSIARWGGDEFVVGMAGMTRQGGMKRLNKLLHLFREHEFAAQTQETLHVTFSAGIAQYPEDGTDLQSLYQAADGAMYQAKQTGRDRMVLACDVPAVKPLQFKQLQNLAHLEQQSREIDSKIAERTAELVTVNQSLQQELEERQQIEETLRFAQTRFAGILAIADDAIISVDAEQNITLFNQGAERIFGYSAEEVLHRPLDILLPFRFAQAHRQHVKAFADTSNQARRMGERGMIAGRRKDGTEFPAEASISKLDLGGEIVFTVILRDVSDRRVVERMKDEFISVVSHELRTPLTSIHGSLSMLASGLLSPDSERGKRLLQIAVDSTDRLMRLINDILDIERIESGKIAMAKQSCNITDLVNQAIEVMQSMADKFGVTLSVDSLPIWIWADPDRIIQTLTNLLSNAIKFSPQNSTVWLNVALREQGTGNREQETEGSSAPYLPISPSPSSSPPLPSLLPAPRDLLMTVQDQGRGIPADKLETIFERFQQVDASDSRNHDGTGLGLAICRSIVQQHGGEIWATSTLGKGSTFYFTLPILHKGDLSADLTKPLVMVCDDDPDIRTVLTTLLEEHSYRVITVTSGQEAIDQAAIYHPDILLLDLIMPEMNGWQVIATLKAQEKTKDIPIMICSVMSPSTETLPGASVVEWLVKPFDEATLFQSLSDVLAESANRIRILLVEDDFDLAQVLTTQLEQQGIEVLHAATGRDAIRLSQQWNPDLLILDLILPDRDGFAVVEWLQQHSSLYRIPLVVYSAKELTPGDRDRLKLGETEFLSKGHVSTQEFEQRVMQLLQPIIQSRREQ
jgi:diguanylate cyclase (GGDEF)-like protein/PAS domain S-box-containing protein